jgi:hypothetical protein
MSERCRLWEQLAKPKDKAIARITLEDLLTLVHQ